MSVTVVAVLAPKQASVQAVRAILTEAVPAVHGESGCELYSLHESEGRFVFVEQWSSEDALDAHNQGPVIARMVAALDGHLDSPAEIIVSRPVLAGDPAKGALRPSLDSPS